MISSSFFFCLPNLNPSFSTDRNFWKVSAIIYANFRPTSVFREVRYFHQSDEFLYTFLICCLGLLFSLCVSNRHVYSVKAYFKWELILHLTLKFMNYFFHLFLRYNLRPAIHMQLSLHSLACAVQLYSLACAVQLYSLACAVQLYSFNWHVCGDFWFSPSALRSSTDANRNFKSYNWQLWSLDWELSVCGGIDCAVLAVMG